MRTSALLLSLAAPAPAAAVNEWIDLFHPPLFTDCPISIITGLSCTSDTACFVTGGQPTTGFHVYKSTEQHFRELSTLTLNAPIPVDLLLGVGMQDETHGVVGGVGLLVDGTWFTRDGQTFNGSKFEVGVLTTQAVYALGKGHYAFVGEGDGEGSQGGVGYSKTGGEFFTAHQLPASLNIPTAASARYGAFPSADTWYVTAGNWPEAPSPSPSPQYKRVSQRLRINLETYKYERVESPGVAASNGTDGYNAVILKTADAGKTWTKQFQDSGNFYFNEVDCASETVCMAVGEGFANDGSMKPGAHIYGTVDGATWSELYVFGAATGGSGLAVTMISETEAWVAATFEKSIFDNGAVFLHTMDGGKTWTEGKALKGVGDVTSMSFINSTCAYASAVTDAQDATVLAFGVSPPPPGPAPVPEGFFVQQQCSDAACSKGCKEGKFAQNSCLQTTSGGSALVNCSVDATTLNTIMYNSSDCTGAGDTHSEATDTCLAANSGGYFENICPNATSTRAFLATFPLQFTM